MKIRELFQLRSFLVAPFCLSFMIVLLSLLVTGVVAQEGKGKATVEDVFIASPLKVREVAEEVEIPASKDSFIASNDPNSNFGFDNLLRFGCSDSGLGATRPLLAFNLEAYIPPAANIQEARLHIYLTAVRGSNTSHRYAVHNVTVPWEEDIVTWNSMPSYGPEMSRGRIGTVLGWQVIDVTNAAEQWLENPNKNRGLILIGIEMPGLEYEQDYFSREAASTALRPYLFVTYELPPDDKAPLASVYHPPEGSWSAADFVLKWEGYDPANSDGSEGTGILWYDVYFTTDGGSIWKIGRAQATNTETTITAAPHKATMGFYARARDNVWNEGPPPSGSSSVQTWTQIDAEAPAASMNPLPEFTATSSFSIGWQDTKELSESGIRYYDVHYREGNGDWQQFVYQTTTTSATFNIGQHGATYQFRARGVDNVGNEQAWEEAQTETTIDVEAPAASMNPLPEFTATSSFSVSWQDTKELSESGIRYYDVQYREENGDWQQLVFQTTATSATFKKGKYGVTYQFRARGVDNVGNEQEWGTAQASTTLRLLDSYMPFVATGK